MKRRHFCAIALGAFGLAWLVGIGTAIYFYSAMTNDNPTERVWVMRGGYTDMPTELDSTEKNLQALIFFLILGPIFAAFIVSFWKEIRKSTNKGGGDA